MDGISLKRFNPSQQVDAFEQDGPVGIPAQAHHAGNVRRMDNPPRNVVIDEQAFEIGEESTAFIVTENVKIAVVGIVLASRIVPEERNAHIGVPAILGGGLHREQQHGGHQTDMIQKLSHLNVI